MTSEKRLDLLPKIPTVSESGLRGFDMSTWWGLVMPAGVKPEIVAKVNAATVKLLQSPDVKQSMANVGADVVGNTPEQFTAFIRDERAKYAKIVKEGNIRME